MTDFVQEQKKTFIFEDIMSIYAGAQWSRDEGTVGNAKFAVLFFPHSYPPIDQIERKLKSALDGDGVIEFVPSKPKHFKVYGAAKDLYKMRGLASLVVLVEDERNDGGLSVLRQVADGQARRRNHLKDIRGFLAIRDETPRLK